MIRSGDRGMRTELNQSRRAPGGKNDDEKSLLGEKKALTAGRG